MMNNNFSG